MSILGDKELREKLQSMIDRDEIEQCLLRYCRGIDRHDRELMLSSYHPDAIDDHGVVVLGADPFCTWAIEGESVYQVVHHMITNMSIEIEADVAHGETYWTWCAMKPDESTYLAFGRYIDRFERRNGEWKIAQRKCLTEIITEVARAEMPESFREALKSNLPKARDRSDPSYLRPFNVDRPLTSS